MHKLLLVEDDPSNRITLSALLEDDGYEVHEAATFDEAERLLGAHAFDAVVLDRRVGSRDGLALAPMVRASSRSARVIVLSGAEAMASAMPDVDAWVTKGRDLSALLEALRPPR